MFLFPKVSWHSSGKKMKSSIPFSCFICLVCSRTPWGFPVKCCNLVTHESSICIICFDDTVVTEAKAQNHSRCSAMFKKQERNFEVFCSSIRSLYCVFWQFQWKQQFVPIVFCDCGLLWRLKTKLSTNFSLDCNSFFLYHIFIGHNDIHWGKKIKVLSSVSVF